MNRFRISLLGTSFTIESDQDDRSMAALLSRLNQAIDIARQQTGAADPLKLAIVGGLILADELAALGEEGRAAESGEAAPAEGTEEAERIAMKILSDLEERLGD